MREATRWSGSTSRRCPGRVDAHRLVPRVHGDRCDDRRSRILFYSAILFIGRWSSAPTTARAQRCVSRSFADVGIPAFVAMRTLADRILAAAGVAFVATSHSDSRDRAGGLRHRRPPVDRVHLASRRHGGRRRRTRRGRRNAVADEGRSGALIGVLVSVTTIPAIGNIGAARGVPILDDVRGATFQLGINIVGLMPLVL